MFVSIYLGQNNPKFLVGLEPMEEKTQNPAIKWRENNWECHEIEKPLVKIKVWFNMTNVHRIWIKRCIKEQELRAHTRGMQSNSHAK